MRKTSLLFGSVIAASLTVVSPVEAATTISFTGSSALDGPDGNIRSFSGGGINVQASGWTLDGSTLQTAWLGQYSGGLGVTNMSEGNGSFANSHTTDNVSQTDFILLVFDRLVNIESAVLTPFWVSWTPLDNDALVSYANLAGAFTSPTPTAVSPASPVWGDLAAAAYNVSGNTTAPYNTSLNSAGKFGNVWVIGAALPSPDWKYDGFKLASISVNSPVPEPGTWAMMLIGFGMVGGALRYSQRKSSVRFQSA